MPYTSAWHDAGVSKPDAVSPPARRRAASPAGRAKPGPSAAAPAAKDAVARASLTPDTWIAAATDVLEHDGIDAVRVDVLAKKLAVTRGSFYWHFRDREDLLRSVLQAWRAAATENLTRRLEGASSDPREQLRDVISLPFRGRSALRASRIELAIRAWARRDDSVRQVADESDAARIGYISQIFSGLGFSPSEARHRALMVYGINVACSQVTPLAHQARQEEWLDFAERLMQGAPLPA